jgi:N-acetylmuramoyl-L-alanine amidase
MNVWVHRAVLMIALIGGSASAALAQPEVRGVRMGDHGDRTRFVLDISENAHHTIFLLADPYRVVVDFPTLRWNIPQDAGKRSEGVIGGFRFGQFKPQTSRVVLDLTGPAVVDKAFVLEPKEGYPYRFVLDLKRQSRAAFLDAMKTWRPPTPKVTAQPRVVPLLKPKGLGEKKVVVIDAGHGGIDPGTISIGKLQEKDLTLAMAKELKRQMDKIGRYKVLLTRSTDTFIRLRDRVEIARRAHADLFLSLHADSIRDHKVRGATVYTLSERASDKEAAELADKENKSDIIAGVDLSGESDEVTSILIDLAQRETMNYSAQFAQHLVPELSKRVRVRTKPHRFAGFVVLKAPDIPSVLVEMGYLSNRNDERLIASRKGRAKLVRAIIEAIDRYFGDRKT